MPVGAASQAFQRKAEQYADQVAGRQAAIRKRARWSRRGAFYMRGTNMQTDPGQLVRPDPAYKRAIEDQIQRVYPETAAAMERHLVPVAESAVAKWPTFTGLSKSLLNLRFSVHGREFRGVVSCFAPYAIFIHRGKSWRQLIREPGEQASRRIAEDIGRQVAR